MSIARVVFLLLFLFADGGIVRPDSSDDFEKFEKMSDDELKKKLSSDGVDVDTLKLLVTEDFTSDSGVKRSVAAAALQKRKTLASLIAQQEAITGNSDAILQNYLTFHASPEAPSIQEHKAPIVEVASKLHKFLDTQVRGKKVETVAMISFVLYRQITWLYQNYLKDLLGEAEKMTYAENAVGMSFFDSRLLTYGDFLLRASFCSVRFYLDMSECVKGFQQGEFLQDPEVFLQNAKIRFDRARRMFSDHDYYGMRLSLFKKVLLKLALPYVWSSAFSRKIAPGDPINNPIMQSALSGAIEDIADEAIAKPLKNAFYKRVTAARRDKLFDRSGGVIQDELFHRLSLWTSEYLSGRFVYHNKKLNAPRLFARRMGEYSIRNVYLHCIVKLIHLIVRGGALQASAGAVHKLGWVLSKLGLFYENPMDKGLGLLRQQASNLGILEEGQPLKEILVYPAAALPGAFARAVRSVITKQKIAFVLAKEPRFISALNAMNGLSVYDLLNRMAVNLMVMQEMSARVVLIKNAVEPKDWARILNAFLNEAILEVFFDRKHFICRQFTESLIASISSPFLNALYDLALPPMQIIRQAQDD